MKLHFPLKDIGSWPRSLRIAAITLIFVLVLWLGFEWLLASPLHHFQQIRIARSNLQQQLGESQEELKHIALYQEESRKLEAIILAANTRFMPEVHAPILINLVLQKVHSSGLKVLSFKNTPLVFQSFYARSPMQFSLVGSYAQFGELCHALLSLKTIVRISSFTLSPVPTQKDPNTLAITLTIDLYYLNSMEHLAPQTKASELMPTVEMLPSFMPYQAEQYSENDHASPFDIHSGSPEQFISPQQQIPLDKMKMMGSIVFQKKAWALMLLPDNKIVRVGLGEKLGSEGGKVSNITESTVTVTPENNTEESMELHLLLPTPA